MKKKIIKKTPNKPEPPIRVIRVEIKDDRNPNIILHDNLIYEIPPVNRQQEKEVEKL